MFLLTCVSFSLLIISTLILSCSLVIADEVLCERQDGEGQSHLSKLNVGEKNQAALLRTTSISLGN